MNNAADIALELTNSLYQDVLEEFGTTRANEIMAHIAATIATDPDIRAEIQKQVDG